MMYHSHVLVCAGTGCTSSNSLQIIENFQRLLAEKGYDKEIQVIRTGCFGLCAAGPIVVVYPAGVYYSHVTPDDVEEIVNEHLIKGRPVQRLIYKEMDEKGVNTTLNESDFYKKQHRIALRNCGLIDPENIDEYIAFDGYKALEKCLTQLSRDDVVEMVVASGLRGRGGGGFPTGLKWKFAKAPESDVKYVCCNADEGDPGAFMDRSVLEGDPHSVLEAMAIGGYLMYRARGDVISSNWLGKSATGVFFVVCAALVLFPAIPRPWAVRMISAALVLTVAAFFSYLYQFVKGLEKRKSH